MLSIEVKSMIISECFKFRVMLSFGFANRYLDITKAVPNDGCPAKGTSYSGVKILTSNFYCHDSFLRM